MFNINKDMLPMKGHYFLFNAGTAPLVPYLPTYAKQLGFSSYIVGIIYTFLPICGLIAKPVFGAIADRFEKHKVVFIAFQILTMIAFSGLYFIPQMPVDTQIDLSCGDGFTYLNLCTKNNNTDLNKCEVDRLMTDESTTNCKMSCSMTNSYMWQTICEYWKIPQYCYKSKKAISFQAKIPKASIVASDDCVYFHLSSVTTSDDKTYVPKCAHNSNEDINTKCKLTCPDKNIDTLLSTVGKNVNLLCQNNQTFMETCSLAKVNLMNFMNKMGNQSGITDCISNCNMDDPLKWMEMCVNWGADDSLSCQPEEKSYPSTIDFTGVIPLGKSNRADNCEYFRLQKIIMPDGSSHYPTCPGRPPFNKSHYHSTCKISCDNLNVNDLLMSTSPTASESRPLTTSSLFLVLLMVLNWIGMAVVVSIADAICFEKLGINISEFGRQRMWGSVGWGVLSLITGVLIDKYSEDQEYKNYTVAFVLMAIFLLMDIFLSLKLKYKQKKISVNILNKVGVLLSSRHTIHFFVWIILVGMCTGLLWQFLFWHLEVLAKTGDDCSQTRWMKTLQGLVSALQCFCGEIPFFFFSGTILKKIGHMNSMTLVLLGFGVRMILYSLLTNPWWVLPIELLQGVTFGMLYTTMASYASVVAPEGTEATIQGLVGAIFEGVGTSLGSFVGGMLMEKLGGALTFRIFGCAALLGCLLNALLQFLFNKRNNEPAFEDYTSVLHDAPDDSVHMLIDRIEST